MKQEEKLNATSKKPYKHQSLLEHVLLLKKKGVAFSYIEIVIRKYVEENDLELDKTLPIYLRHLEEQADTVREIESTITQMIPDNGNKRPTTRHEYRYRWADIEPFVAFRADDTTGD